MKHLILMRHANAGAAADDRERPLSAAGQSAARQMGRALATLEASGFRPEWALVSPARRAQETLAGVRSGLSCLSRADTDDALYPGSPGRLLSRLQRLPDQTAQLLLLGHNPGLSELVQLLVGRAVSGLAPAACAALRIDIVHWRDLTPGSADLVELLRP